MHIARTLLTLLSVPLALSAQDVVPDDWTYRLDGSQAFAAGQEVQPGEWRYTRMAPGWHITTTEQGTTLLPKDRTVEGRWGIEVELFLFPDPSDAPFGVIVEAADTPAGTMQLQFLTRRDGQAALVAQHGHEEALLVPWTADTGVTAHAGGVVKYILRVMHEEERLIFSINGREMFAQPTMGEDHRSIPGLRVGPGLNLHVSRFDLVTPLAPARTR
jgi:hypothetical protein